MSTQASNWPCPGRLDEDIDKGNLAAMHEAGGRILHRPLSPTCSRDVAGLHFEIFWLRHPALRHIEEQIAEGDRSSPGFAYPNTRG